MNRAGPNILILHLDEIRADCLGAYGNSEVYTPHIDRLAADGVVFTRHYCSFPVCTPSRYSLISGQYVHQHRGRSNHTTMIPGTPAFPAILRDAGYRTACTGKMHYTPTYLDVGFGQMQLAEQNGVGRYDDDYHRWLRERELVDFNDLEDQESEYRVNARDIYWKTFGAMPSNLPEDAHSTTWITARSLELLEQWDAGGSLLMVGYIKPHHPFDPPQRWMDYYDPDSLSLPAGWLDEPPECDMSFGGSYFDNLKLDEAALRQVTAGYYATISHIDEQIGRILTLLDERGLYDDTLIVFTGDHGDYLGFHHLLLKGNHMYEPLARIPLIVKWPGGRDKGMVDSQMSSNVDVAPTILSLSGQPVPASMAGIDLTDAAAARDVVCAEGNGQVGWEVMARNSRFKLLYCLLKPENNMLLEPGADPNELDNLWGLPEHAVVQQELVDAVLAWFPSAPYESYLDEDAPVCSAANVPARGDGHRKALCAYYETMMAAAYRESAAQSDGDESAG